MENIRITDTPVRPKWLLHPGWWAVMNLLISLFGILFLNWNLQPIVYLFWMEVIFSLGAALIRVLGAKSGRPFADTLLPKLGTLAFGAVMSMVFIMLTVAFTIGAFDTGLQSAGFENIRWQVLLLLINYLAAVVVHFFLNERYKNATPVGELMSTFVRLLFLLCLLMVITQHLLPRFPQLNAAHWTGVAILVLKFAADWIAAQKAFRPIEEAVRAETP